MRILAVLFVVVLAGCAADPEKLNRVAVSETERMTKPSVQLSAFSDYELKPFVLSDAIAREEDKVKEAAKLEQKVKEKLAPLFAQWSSTSSVTPARTLVVQPELQKLKIVSGGARFFAGAFMGSSNIDMDLKLIDGRTGQVIAKPRIQRSASSLVGAWSVGQSDENLHDYITHITHQYILTSY